jgi:hypothetical protein
VKILPGSFEVRTDQARAMTSPALPLRIDASNTSSIERPIASAQSCLACLLYFRSGGKNTFLSAMKAKKKRRKICIQHNFLFGSNIRKKRFVFPLASLG